MSASSQATAERTVLQELKHFARVGLVVSASSTIHLAERLVESGKAMMIAMARQFISKAAGRPLLVSYSIDGTTMRANTPCIWSP